MLTEPARAHQIQAIKMFGMLTADHLKLMFPMCWTVSHMAWAMAEGKRMLKSAEYDGVSNWDAACHSLEHALEFLLNCYISPGEFVAQVLSPWM